MKILEVKELAIPGVKVIKFERFKDFRGYFTETMRDSEMMSIVTGQFDNFVQYNETWSKAGTFRGLHMQWNPYMGKLVRCISGFLVDFALDVRLGSPTFGKMIAHSMPNLPNENYSEWIWVPPGFAHGTLLLEDSYCEYLCTGEYNSNCETGINIFDTNIEWLTDNPSLCGNKVYRPEIRHITDKDRDAFNLDEWLESPNAKEFVYEKGC